MKKHFIVLPENLNLEERLELYPPDFKFDIEFAKMVISDIIIASAFRYDFGKNDQDLYVPRKSTILQDFKREYKLHMRYLSQHIIGYPDLLWRKDYKPKKNSFKYRLSPTYEGRKVVLKFLTDPKLIRKIENKNEFKISNKIMKRYKFLVGYFDKNRLKVQLEIALSYLYRSNKSNSKKEHMKYLLNVGKVLKIQNGEYFMRYNPLTDGRIHTNITSFPKELRKFLRYDGKRLGEVDISASVPTFLCYLVSEINKNFKNPILPIFPENVFDDSSKNDDTIKVNLDEDNIAGSYPNLVNINEDYINSIITNDKNYYNSYMLVNTLVSIDITEIERFKKLIEEKGFYDYFIDDFNTIHHFDTKLEPYEYYQINAEWTLDREFLGDLDDFRPIIKKTLLSMLNSGKGFLNERAVFQAKFPTIYRFIQEFKKENHKFFSHMILQIESFFMLDKVAREINNKYRRKIPLLSLHDCLISTEDNIEVLKNDMQNIFNEALGFQLQLKSKVFK